MSTVLVAHPSPDLYGSDRQLLETIRALTDAGHRVNAALPDDGPPLAELEALGAPAAIVPFTVPATSPPRPRAPPVLAAPSGGEPPRWRALLQATDASLAPVSTVTLPWWAPAGRAAGVPVLAHVHEAEDTQNLLVRAGLNAPLLAASRVVVNSQAAHDTLVRAQPLLARRTQVVHNGVPAPEAPPRPLRERLPQASFRIAMVARLSPRKGVDVALEALGHLRADGLNASLRLCGSVFPGYEWYEEQLRERAARPDLAGHVELLGYVHPTWPVLYAADAVVVPSRVEPFGNTAVEAMHAERPLVASRAQGLAEVVTDGVTGLLVEPDSPRALADALLSLAADPGRARTLARTARREAAKRFGVERYRTAMVEVVEDLLSEGAAS